MIRITSSRRPLSAFGLDPSVQDLPAWSAQVANWISQKASNPQEAKDKAKNLLNFAYATPLAPFVPVAKWLVDFLPSRSAGGEGDTNVYCTHRSLPFVADQWQVIDGEWWYFTKRGDTYGSIVQTYSYCEGDHVYQGPGFPEIADKPKDVKTLYDYQADVFKSELPWGDKVHVCTEFPGNVPLRMPPCFVEGAKRRYGLVQPPPPIGALRTTPATSSSSIWAAAAAAVAPAPKPVVIGPIKHSGTAVKAYPCPADHPLYPKSSFECNPVQAAPYPGYPAMVNGVKHLEIRKCFDGATPYDGKNVYGEPAKICPATKKAADKLAPADLSFLGSLPKWVWIAVALGVLGAGGGIWYYTSRK